MPKKASLPPDTNVCYNPYATKSGRGKFFSARVGKKVTGTKSICQRFATEGDAHRWVLQKVAEYEKLHADHGKAARQMNPQQYAAALLAFETLGTAAPDILTDLANFWAAAGKPTSVDLTRLRNSMVLLETASVDVITQAISYFNTHSPDATQKRTLRSVFDEWLVWKGGESMRRDSKKKALPSRGAPSMTR
eukprot:gene68125-93331_t